MPSQMNSKLQKKLNRELYRACPGKSFHEKIIHIPEAIHRLTQKYPGSQTAITMAKRIADEVATTQHRYLLSPEVAGAAVAVSETRNESLERLIPVIRFPHQRMWIELSEKDRGHFAQIAGVEELREDTFKPDHTGFLITADETGRKGTMEMCLFDRDMGFRPYPYQLRFDLDDPAYHRDPFRPDADPSSLKTFPSFKSASWTGREINSYGEYTHLALASSLHGLSDPRDEESSLIHDNHALGARMDVEGEWRFLISTIAMICLRNGIDRDPEEARFPRSSTRKGSLARRLERQEEVAPKIIRMEMSLSRDPKRRAGQGRSMARSPARHWVCGHFKVRKNGVYWWSPHLRGDKARDHSNIPREISVHV